MTTMTRRELLKASGTAGLATERAGAPLGAIEGADPIGTLSRSREPAAPTAPTCSGRSWRWSSASTTRGDQRPADPALPRGRPDERRSRRARGAQADRRSTRGRDRRHVGLGGDPGRQAALCRRPGFFVIGVSGADSVTRATTGLHARTQPNTNLQGRMYGKFAASKKEWEADRLHGAADTVRRSPSGMPSRAS